MTPIQMVARFHDARDTIRRRYPDSWRAQLDRPMSDLRRTMAHFGEDVVHAALRIARNLKANGELDNLHWYLAAAAEIAEPTP